MAMFEPPSNLPLGIEPEDIFASQGGAPARPAPAVARPAPGGGPTPPPPPPRPAPPIVQPPRPGALGVPAPLIRPPAFTPSRVEGPRGPEAAATIAETPARGLGRKIIRLVIFAVIAAGLVTGGIIAYNTFFKVAEFETGPIRNVNINRNENVNVPVVSPPPDVNAPVVNAPIVNAPPENVNAPVTGTDTDGDGLTDTEEAVLGTNPVLADSDSDGLTDSDEVRVHTTNPMLADTDADGLSDRDEVVTWKTDPKNPDTDGDTYNDGQEVQGGYNPLGPGKLLPPIPAS